MTKTIKQLFAKYDICKPQELASKKHPNVFDGYVDKTVTVDNEKSR